MYDVVVVGGGVAGLVAARDLAAAGRQVLLIEGSARIGGKLRTAEVGGLSVDVGAEAMLARRPEGVELAGELDADLVHPTSAASLVWSYGRLRPLPRSLMGVPFDVDEVAQGGVLSDAGVERMRHERLTDVPADIPSDISVGDLVAERLGDEVTERLVEPLLGGVYAGHAREISAAAAVPQLLAMARRGSLLEQAAAVPASDAPVFASLPGGMGRLPGLLADGSFEVLPMTFVDRVEKAADGFRLTAGATTYNARFDARQVVLATPAAPTARLLADVAPRAAAELAGLDYASVAVVTHVFRNEDLADWLFDHSGFLVPPVEQRAIKASTLSFGKWAWVRELADDLCVLRTSFGRAGEAASLQVDDEALVRASLLELLSLAGISAMPVADHVQRWGGGLPQYVVGHLDRIGRTRADLPAGLALCGAAYDGVGIPAVIGSARRAVADLLAAE